MATFNFTPSAGTKKTPKARTRKMQFGRGYSQRAGDGINNIEETWNIVLDVLSVADADAIEAFFEARGGHESFNWTPPGGTAGKYICETWPRTPSRAQDTELINATFIKVFEA